MNFGAEFRLGKIEETGGGGHLDGEDGGILPRTRQHQLNNSSFILRLFSYVVARVADPHSFHPDPDPAF
jgi:hypothetical protein